MNIDKKVTYTSKMAYTYTIVLKMRFYSAEYAHRDPNVESMVKRAKNTNAKDMIQVFLNDADITVDEDSARFQKTDKYLGLVFDVCTKLDQEDIDLWLYEMPLEDSVYESERDNGWVLCDENGDEIGHFDYREYPGKSDCINVV